MSQNSSAQIRTVALVGHGAAGKTTLAESLLAASGAISSRGSVEKGNTVCDFDPIEKELGHSLQASLVSFNWGGTRVHLIDTPGYPDFAGQAIAALAAVDTALVQRTDWHRTRDRAHVHAGRRAQAMPHDRGQQDRRRQCRSAGAGGRYPRALRQAMPAAGAAGTPGVASS